MIITDAAINMARLTNVTTDPTVKVTINRINSTGITIVYTQQHDTTEVEKSWFLFSLIQLPKKTTGP